MKFLTTTSYAMLGLLALKPWTTYELAQQMERSLSNFWPRAKSKLYEEPKNLVAHGLANAEREMVGKRSRTVYSITPAGRESLRAWLDTPGAPMTLEFEALLKVFFADQGSKDQLLAQIASIRRWARAEDEKGIDFLREYSESGGPFPARLSIIGLMVDLLAHLNETISDWADRAETEVATWRDTRQPGDRAFFRRLMERSEQRVGGNRAD